MASLLDEIRTRAAADSPLWERALLPGEAPAPEFEGRCPQPYLLGVEMIREGYLLHNGRARLFTQDDADLALLTGFVAQCPVTDFPGAKANDPDRYARFHAHMLERGVYLAPSQFEAMMPSLAHTAEQVEMTAAAAREFDG
jgi:hypothetical protein